MVTQQEISTGHAPALQAADEQLFVRDTIRAVATGRVLVASPAPKPVRGRWTPSGIAFSGRRFAC